MCKMQICRNSRGKCSKIIVLHFVEQRIEVIDVSKFVTIHSNFLSFFSLSRMRRDFSFYWLRKQWTATAQIDDRKRFTHANKWPTTLSTSVHSTACVIHEWTSKKHQRHYKCIRMKNAHICVYQYNKRMNIDVRLTIIPFSGIVQTSIIVENWKIIENRQKLVCESIYRHYVDILRQPSFSVIASECMWENSMFGHLRWIYLHCNGTTTAARLSHECFIGENHQHHFLSSFSFLLAWICLYWSDCQPYTHEHVHYNTHSETR